MLTNTSNDGGPNASQHLVGPDANAPVNFLQQALTPNTSQLLVAVPASGGSKTLLEAWSAVMGAPAAATSSANALSQPQMSSETFVPGEAMSSMAAQAATPDYTITQGTDGSGNQVTTYAMNAGGSVQVTDFASSTQVVVTGSVAGDTQTYSLAANAQINFGESGTLAATGVNNQIFIGGTGETLDIAGTSSGNLLIALGTGVQITQTSAETSPIALANASATVNAEAHNIWVAQGESANITSNSSTTITLDGSDTVTVTGGINTINSANGSDTLTIGSGIDIVNGSNETIALTGGPNFTANGANESISATSASANVTLTNTTGIVGTDRVSTNAPMNVTINDGAQQNFVSGPAYVRFAQSNGNVTVSNTLGTMFVQLGSASLTGNTVNLGQNASEDVVGGGFTINVTGSGDQLELEGTSGIADTVNASNTSIQLLHGGVQVLVVGGGNTIDDTTSSPGVPGTSTISLSNTNGNWDSVTSWEGDGIALNGNTQVNIYGDNNGISTSGSNISVSLYDTASIGDSFTGSNDSIILNAGASTGVNGGGNTITATGSGAIAVLLNTNGNADTFIGSNGTVWIEPSSQAVVYGGGDIVKAYGPTAATTFSVTTSASFLANQQELYRIYQAVLGRAPDADGFQYWVNQLQNGVSDGSIVAGFMGSPEFQAKYGALNNTQFVTALYQNVLGRQPDASGLQYWVNSLNNGLARPQLVLTFANSTEFESNSAAAVQAYITSSRFASLSANSAQQLGDIYRLYEAGLGRAPDAGGLNYWSYQIQNGTPESSIAQGFVNSPEFQQHYPASESNTDFVTALYQNVLGRQPDSAGLQYWVNQLNSGMSRAQLLTTLSDSAEYQSNTAAAETEFMNGALYGYWQT